MSLKEIAKRQILLCFEALENLIDKTPNNIWNQKKGGYVFWQQILHAMNGQVLSLQ